MKITPAAGRRIVPTDTGHQWSSGIAGCACVRPGKPALRLAMRSETEQAKSGQHQGISFRFRDRRRITIHTMRRIPAVLQQAGTADTL